MGTYVYSVRSKEHKVVLEDGNEIVVRPLIYLCKPVVWSFMNSENGSLNRLMSRAETNYAKKGNAEYLILTDDDKGRISEFDMVFKHDSPDCGLLYDDKPFGTFVGYVAKSGRKWNVVSPDVVELELRTKILEKMKNGTYKCTISVTDKGYDASNWEEFRDYMTEKDNGKPGSFKFFAINAKV